jgi:hypothetical protein
MKSRIITKAALCAAAFVAAGWFAQPASAQAGFQGKFTLPFEARWGQAILPPGDYQLTFVPVGVSTELVIRDATSLRPVALEPVNVREDSKGGRSALLIDMWGNQPVVYSLSIAELGEAFVYERPPAHSHAAEETRQTQAIPVLLAEK